MGRSHLASALKVEIRKVPLARCEMPGCEKLSRVLTAATAAAAAISAAGTFASGALFTRTRFVDGDGATLDALAVDLGNGGGGAFRRGHGHEGEAAWPVGRAIHDEIDLRNRSAGREEVLQVVFGGVKGKIPDV